jgi:hypothetical protein
MVAPNGWMGIDPVQQSAEFFHLGLDGMYARTIVSGDGIVRSEVVAGLWMKIQWLWDRPPLHALRAELGLP